MKFATTLAIASSVAAGLNDQPWNVTMNGTRFWGSSNTNATGAVVGNYTIMSENGNKTYYKVNYTAWNETGQDMYANGRLEEVRAVSDYLYYGLDAWGKANRNNTNPQCSDSNACHKIGENACCASINMRNMWANQSHYMFRCLNTGLIQNTLSFKLRDTLNVNVRCKDGLLASSAAKLGASVVAATAAIASLY